MGNFTSDEDFNNILNSLLDERVKRKLFKDRWDKLDELIHDQMGSIRESTFSNRTDYDAGRIDGLLLASNLMKLIEYKVYPYKE